MAWFKVDDRLPLHSKFFALPMSAIGLWTMAGAWCGQQLTDGRVPKALVLRLGGAEEDAVALVKAGLWHEEPEGYRFHDWLDYQPSKEDADAKREAARLRMAQVRKKRKEATDDQELAPGPRDASAERDKPGPPQEAPPEEADNEEPDDEEPDDVEGDEEADEADEAEDEDDQGDGYPPAAADASIPSATRGGLEDLRSRLEDAGLEVSWSGVERDRQEIERLLAKHHGPAALVTAAKRMHNPNDPARSYRAWLDEWRLLRPRPPSKAAPSTTAGQCPVHPGEPLARCSQCNRPGTPMPADVREVRENLRRRRKEKPDERDHAVSAASAPTRPPEGER